jgi:hypothetical protein
MVSGLPKRKRMMSKSKEYRALAEECDQHAASAHDPDIKNQFQERARRWRELEIQAALTIR